MAESKGRILIVGPDLSSLNDLSALLETLGNQVAIARSGDEGLRRFWEFLPDLAFFDLVELGEAGERMCRELKRTDFGVITPIVVYSDRHPTMTRVEAMRHFGAVDYVFKPYQDAKVKALLEWSLAARNEVGQPLAHEVLDRLSLTLGTEGAVSMESGSLPYLLGRAEEERLSGLLVMTAGNHRSVLSLEQGLIVGGSSNAPAEQLERILLSMRKLTPAQLAEVKSKAQNGSELLPLLSFLGLLRADERVEVLRYQALMVGISMFRTLSGQLQFRRGESIDCARLDAGIRPTTLALIGLRKSAALLRAATDRFVRDPMVFQPPSTSARVSYRSLPLTKLERTVLNSVDGTRNVKELRELGRIAQIDLDEPLAVLVGSGILKPSPVQPTSAPAARVELPARGPATPPSTGSLERRPFIDLVGALLCQGATGMLTVEGAASRSFAFVDRQIVYARSSRPEDSLGRLLLAERMVSREALDRALAVQRQLPERRLGSLLVEMHELSPDALMSGLRSQVMRILEDTFGWQFGSFTFVPGEQPPDWSIRLESDPVSLLRHGSSKLSHQQLKSRWGRRGTRLVASSEHGDTAVLSLPERELLLEAAHEHGVDLGTSNIGVLRRAHLLVVAGFAHVTGDAASEPEVERESVTESATVPGEPEQARAVFGTEHPLRGAYAVAEPSEASLGKMLASAGPDLAAAAQLREVGRSAELSFDIVTETPTLSRAERSVAPGVLPPRTGEGESTAALIAFLRDEVLADKRALDARLRGTEGELRGAMEEMGRLRERARQLESENRMLRRRLGLAEVQDPSGELSAMVEPAPLASAAPVGEAQPAAIEVAGLPAEVAGAVPDAPALPAEVAIEAAAVPPAGTPPEVEVTSAAVATMATGAPVTDEAPPAIEVAVAAESATGNAPKGARTKSRSRKKKAVTPPKASTRRAPARAGLVSAASPDRIQRWTTGSLDATEVVEPAREEELTSDTDPGANERAASFTATLAAAPRKDSGA